MTRKLLAALGVAVTVATALVATAAPASAVVGYNKLFQNQNSRKCLEISYGSTANFARAGQYYCYGGPVEQWNYNTATGIMQNVNSGKCLEIQYSSTANFAPAGQYDCHGGMNQKWYLLSNGSIVNQNSGKCLEVAYSSMADFAAVGQYVCHGGLNQKWWWS